MNSLSSRIIHGLAADAVCAALMTAAPTAASAAGLPATESAPTSTALIGPADGRAQQVRAHSSRSHSSGSDSKRGYKSDSGSERFSRSLNDRLMTRTGVSRRHRRMSVLDRIGLGVAAIGVIIVVASVFHGKKK